MGNLTRISVSFIFQRPPAPACSTGRALVPLWEGLDYSPSLHPSPLLGPSQGTAGGWGGHLDAVLSCAEITEMLAQLTPGVQELAAPPILGQQG